ncbi:MAG: PAS domain-containing protein [Sulfuritalea sp.]|jgi:PAS domain S-box-containing protein|nr:PAS domain-containing protein [Sulfuritalea sp.]
MMLKRLFRFLLGTLRGRLIVSVAAVHAVMMALFIADLTARQGAMLMDRQIEDATALSQSLATSAAGWIVAEDVSGLQELVEVQRRYPEVLFVMLVDKEGRVLADTDQSRLGFYMRDLPREVRQTLLAETPALVDVAVPAVIGERHVGWARVGIGQKAAGEKLAAITRSGVAYALAAILIGSLVAWFMGRWITRRLYAVQETFDAVRSGNHLARSKLAGSDEAAAMAGEFNAMLDALAQRDAELRESEELHRLTLSNIDDAVFITDDAGTFKYICPNVDIIFGYSFQEVQAIGNILDLLGRDTPPPSESFGELKNIERDITDKSGKVRSLLVNVKKISIKSGTRLYTCRDITERKQAEEALRKSENDLKEAQRVAHTGSWDWDMATDVITWSEEYYHIYGFDPTQRPPGYAEHLKAYTPESAARLDAAVNRNIQTGESYELDLELARPEGPRGWITARSETRRDAQGHVIGLRGTAQDITERKQAEEDIRRLNERFSLATRAARLGVWDWDLEKNQLVWDDGMYALYGVSREDFAGAYEAWLNGLHPDDRAASDEISKQAQRGERDYDTEFRVVWPDGSIHHLKAYGQFVRDADGKPLRMTGVNYDVTERKRAEEQLRRSERGLSEAQRMAHLGNWELDLESNALTWSDEIFRIFEIDPERFDASYDAFLNAIHPDDRDLVNKAYTDSVKSRLPYDIVHRLRMPDGRIKYVNEKCETYYGADGKPLRSVGTVHDITERKRAEDQVLELNQQLEQRVTERTAQLEAANKELEAFAYSVSHDLRAPLRHIDGYVELLVSRCRDGLNDKGLHYVDTIAASARQMGVLIDDLLQFSRTGRAELHREDVDMNRGLLEALGPIKESNAKRNIEWVIGNLPPVRGDAALLRQVWANLLENAVKFTRSRENARIEVDAREEKGETIFVVRDNGVGFDMRYVGKLFGVFQRLHSQEEFDGTGIGLATVQRIVFRHGGRVWAEAELNRGATFYFSLPDERTV